MHYHNPFHQKRHTTKASHGIKFVTSITTTIALILVCALAVSQIIPTDRTDRSAKVAQGKTTRSKKTVKTTFTPASKDVQNLVCNGVREIVRDYAVDGIHFDDYFYPNLGAKYKKVFDYKEYKAYAKRCKKKHKKKVSIVTWRRNNVSNMLKRVRTIVHRLDNNCVFGISPAGNIRNLYAKNNYYADVKKWMRSSKYIDYICPQIYWTFNQKTCPFRETTNKWLAIPRAKSVKVYVGLGGYRAGISKREAKLGADAEWGTSRTNLKRQLLYLRSQNGCGGFMLFSYSDLIRKSARSEMKRFTKLLKTVPSNAVGPTATPTAAPTTVPTAVPTETPTDAPTDSSTTAPTETPAAAPTNSPTVTGN